MDVTLGVAVDRATAQIALLDAAPPHAVIDQSHIDLIDVTADSLVSTLVSTDHLLAEAGHRLVGTTVCSSDSDRAAALVAALTSAGLAHVSTVANSTAVTAATHALVGEEITAALVSDGETAALSIVDADADVTALIAVEQVVGGDRNAAFRTLLERFSEEPGGATSVILLGAPGDGAETDVLRQASPVPLHVPEGHEYAVARGAALAGFRAQHSIHVESEGDSLSAAETVMSPQAHQLAYSEVDDEEDPHLASAVPLQTPMRLMSVGDPDEFEVEEGEAPVHRPRVLLLGSTVAAVVVVGFAALAVSVAIGIRPAVDAQAVRLTDDSLAGKYFPVAPGQGTMPDPPAWTAIEELPAPGEVTDARTLRPKLVSSTRAMGDAGAPIIKYYNDGTIGLQSAPLAGGGIPGPGVAAQAPEYLTRLIPDFSRWSPCQVLAFVSNVRMMGETAAEMMSPGNRAAANSISRAADTAFGGISDLSDLGAVAVVQKDTGPLFSATKNVADGVPDTDAIPVQLFEKGTTELPTATVADMLPVGSKIVDTKVLESLPTTAGAEKSSPASILTETLSPEVAQSLPGTEGSAPIATPDLKLPQTTPGTDLTTDVPGGKLPGTELGDAPRPLEIPGVNKPILEPPVQAPVEPPAKFELPGVNKPILEPPVQAPVEPPAKIELPGVNKPILEPPVQAPVSPPKVIDPPKPVIDVPKPVIDLPKPVINLPKPVIEAPKPVIEAPVQAPADIPVPAPAPKFELPIPKLPIPAPVAPPPPVDVPSAPEVPSIPIPTLPELPKLPFGGSLFGNG
ncbi:hypothetical protein [Mycobacterium sp. ACS4331]|uniref:hypothetical protein n=1 Tax=Mycobacterium sp. ACS4331 TaxID=1834121 RepID=UPI0007FDCCE8|nr:hypothetical protein [Mycobacterium sp. ACS4331]OBF29135.1 hypothetical protein A5727_24110 [Mycobacterium sp. ACS4331]